MILYFTNNANIKMEESKLFTITTDGECHECLNILKTELKLSNEEQELLDRCINVVGSENGEDVMFGPCEIAALSILTIDHPSKGVEIIACLNHLSESVDFFGDFPEDVLEMFNTETHKIMESLISELSDSEEDI